MERCGSKKERTRNETWEKFEGFHIIRQREGTNFIGKGIATNPGGGNLVNVSPVLERVGRDHTGGGSKGVKAKKIRNNSKKKRGLGERTEGGRGGCWFREGTVHAVKRKEKGGRG